MPEAYPFQTKAEFLTAVRAKFPQYAETDDATLYDAVIAKAPQYRDQIAENVYQLPDTWVGSKPSRDLRLLPEAQEYVKLIDRERTGDTRSFLEAVTDWGAGDVPFAGDFFDVGKIVLVTQAANRIKAGTANDSDLIRVNTWLAKQRQLENASVVSKAGDIAKNSVKFWAEIAGIVGAAVFTAGPGGIAAAGEMVAGKTAATGAKALALKTAEELAAKAATGAVSTTVKESLAAAGARMTASRGVYEALEKGAVEQVKAKLPQFIANDAIRESAAKIAVQGVKMGVVGTATAFLNPNTYALKTAHERELMAVLTGDDSLKENAVMASLFDSWIQNASEQSGPIVAEGVGALFAKIGGEKGRQLAAKFLKSSIFSLAFGKYGVKSLEEAGQWMEKLGVNGVLEEMAEERVGGAMSAIVGAVTGDRATLRDGLSSLFPDMKQLMAEGIAFSIPGLGLKAAGAGINLAQSMRDKAALNGLEGVDRLLWQAHTDWRLSQSKPANADEAAAQLTAPAPDRVVEQFRGPLETIFPGEEAKVAGMLNDLRTSAEPEQAVRTVLEQATNSFPEASVDTLPPAKRDAYRWLQAAALADTKLYRADGYYANRRAELPTAVRLDALTRVATSETKEDTRTDVVERTVTAVPAAAGTVVTPAEERAGATAEDAVNRAVPELDSPALAAPPADEVQAGGLPSLPMSELEGAEAALAAPPQDMPAVPPAPAPAAAAAVPVEPPPAVAAAALPANAALSPLTVRPPEMPAIPTLLRRTNERNTFPDYYNDAHYQQARAAVLAGQGAVLRKAGVLDHYPDLAEYVDKRVSPEMMADPLLPSMPKGNEADLLPLVAVDEVHAAAKVPALVAPPAAAAAAAAPESKAPTPDELLRQASGVVTGIPVYGRRVTKVKARGKAKAAPGEAAATPAAPTEFIPRRIASQPELTPNTTTVATQLLNDFGLLEHAAGGHVTLFTDATIGTLAHELFHTAFFGRDKTAKNPNALVSLMPYEGFLLPVRDWLELHHDLVLPKDEAALRDSRTWQLRVKVKDANGRETEGLTAEELVVRLNSFFLAKHRAEASVQDGTVSRVELKPLQERWDAMLNDMRDRFEATRSRRAPAEGGPLWAAYLSKFLRAAKYLADILSATARALNDYVGVSDKPGVRSLFRKDRTFNYAKSPVFTAFRNLYAPTLGAGRERMNRSEFFFELRQQMIDALMAAPHSDNSPVFLRPGNAPGRWTRVSRADLKEQALRDYRATIPDQVDALLQIHEAMLQRVTAANVAAREMAQAETMAADRGWSYVPVEQAMNPDVPPATLDLLKKLADPNGEAKIPEELLKALPTGFGQSVAVHFRSNTDALDALRDDAVALLQEIEQNHGRLALIQSGDLKESGAAPLPSTPLPGVPAPDAMQFAATMSARALALAHINDLGRPGEVRGSDLRTALHARVESMIRTDAKKDVPLQNALKAMGVRGDNDPIEFSISEGIDLPALVRRATAVFHENYPNAEFAFSNADAYEMFRRSEILRFVADRVFVDEVKQKLLLGLAVESINVAREGVDPSAWEAGIVGTAQTTNDLTRNLPPDIGTPVFSARYDRRPKAALGLSPEAYHDVLVASQVMDNAKIGLATANAADAVRREVLPVVARTLSNRGLSERDVAKRMTALVGNMSVPGIFAGAKLDIVQQVSTLAAEARKQLAAEVAEPAPVLAEVPVVAAPKEKPKTRREAAVLVNKAKALRRKREKAEQVAETAVAREVEALKVFNAALLKETRGKLQGVTEEDVLRAMSTVMVHFGITSGKSAGAADLRLLLGKIGVVLSVEPTVKEMAARIVATQFRLSTDEIDGMMPEELIAEATGLLLDAERKSQGAETQREMVSEATQRQMAGPRIGDIHDDEDGEDAELRALGGGRQSSGSDRATPGTHLHSGAEAVAQGERELAPMYAELAAALDGLEVRNIPDSLRYELAARFVDRFPSEEAAYQELQTPASRGRLGPALVPAVYRELVDRAVGRGEQEQAELLLREAFKYSSEIGVGLRSNREWYQQSGSGLESVVEDMLGMETAVGLGRRSREDREADARVRELAERPLDAAERERLTEPVEEDLIRELTHAGQLASIRPLPDDTVGTNSLPASKLSVAIAGVFRGWADADVRALARDAGVVAFKQRMASRSTQRQMAAERAGAPVDTNRPSNIEAEESRFMHDAYVSMALGEATTKAITDRLAGQLGTLHPEMSPADAAEFAQVVADGIRSRLASRLDQINERHALFPSPLAALMSMPQSKLRAAVSRLAADAALTKELAQLMGRVSVNWHKDMNTLLAGKPELVDKVRDTVNAAEELERTRSARGKQLAESKAALDALRVELATAADLTAAQAQQLEDMEAESVSFQIALEDAESALADKTKELAALTDTLTQVQEQVREATLAQGEEADNARTLARKRSQRPRNASGGGADAAEDGLDELATEDENWKKAVKRLSGKLEDPPPPNERDRTVHELVDLIMSRIKEAGWVPEREKAIRYNVWQKIELALHDSVSAEKLLGEAMKEVEKRVTAADARSSSSVLDKLKADGKLMHEIARAQELLGEKNILTAVAEGMKAMLTGAPQLDADGTPVPGARVAVRLREILRGGWSRQEQFKEAVHRYVLSEVVVASRAEELRRAGVPERAEWKAALSKRIGELMQPASIDNISLGDFTNALTLAASTGLPPGAIFRRLSQTDHLLGEVSSNVGQAMARRLAAERQKSVAQALIRPKRTEQFPSSMVQSMLEKVYMGIFDARDTAGARDAEKQQRWDNWFAETYHIPHMTEELKAKISDYAREIDAETSRLRRMFRSYLPKAMHAFYYDTAKHRRLQQDMLDEIARQVGASGSSLLSAVFYGNALSGFSTQEVNLLGTLQQFLATVTVGGINTYLGEGRGSRPRDFQGFARSVSQSLGALAWSFKHLTVPTLQSGRLGGAPVAGMQEVTQRNSSLVEIGAENYMYTGPLGRLFDRFPSIKPYLKWLNLYKYPQRLLKMADAGATRAAFANWVQRKAEEQGLEMGLEGDALRAWIGANAIASHMSEKDRFDAHTPEGVTNIAEALAAISEATKQKLVYNENTGLNPQANITVAERLQDMVRALQLAQAKAVADGHKAGTVAYQLSVEESLYNLMSDKWKIQSQIWAGRASYNLRKNDPLYETRFATIAREAIDPVRAKIPGAAFFFPFVSIVTNVVNVSSDYLPFYNAWQRKKLEARLDEINQLKGEPISQLSEEDLQELQVKGMIGGALLTAVVAMSLAAAYANPDDPWFELTAQGPKDLKKRNQMRETGFQEYTVKIGGVRYNYVYSPLAIPFAIAGSFLDSVKYRDVDEDTALGVAANGMLMGVTSVFDQTFLTNVSDLFNIISSPNAAAQQKAASQLFARTTATMTPFVGANALKQLSRLADPNLYNSQTLWEMYLREMPVPIPDGKLWAMPRRYNAFGEPIRLGSPSALLSVAEATFRDPTRLGRLATFEQRQSDPVWNWVARSGINLPVPGKNQLLNGLPMTTVQFEEFQVRRGRMLKERLAAALSAGTLANLTGEDAQKFMDQLAARVSLETKAQMGARRG